jgi:pimeloyl-ACP methyl ester carboxylesterase
MPGFFAGQVEAGPWRLYHRASPGSAEDRGPTYVLVHGLIVSGRYLMPLAVRLAAERRVLVPDLPGFGASEKPRRPLEVPDLAGVLAAYLGGLGLERVVLVANSFGCQIAAAMAARDAGPVERMVLIGPTVDAAARGAPRQLARMIGSLFREPAEYPLILAADFLRVGLPRALRAANVALADRIEEVLPRVVVSTLVLRGSDDLIVPRRWAEEVTRLLPAGRLAEVPGGGHALNYGAAEATCRLIRAFAEPYPMG